MEINIRQYIERGEIITYPIEFQNKDAQLYVLKNEDIKIKRLLESYNLPKLNETERN